MITCSRCGKENQDLYKFCLGCGAKLQAGAAAAPKPAPPPVDVYPVTPPPEPIAPPAAVSAPVVAKTAAPPAPDDGFPTGGPSGIPAPGTFGAVQPAQPSFAPPAQPSFAPPAAAPIAQTVVPPASFAPQATPFAPSTPLGRVPTASPPTSVPSVQIGLGSVPMQVPTRPSPMPKSPSGAIPLGGAKPATTNVPPTAVSAVQMPHSSPFSPPPLDMVVCPSCGKQVASAFAFCGGCGHRMKQAPGAIAEAAVQRADAVAPAPARVALKGHLTLIRPDGTEGGVHPLQEGPNLVGRGQGTLFDTDPYLSPRHAEFVLSEEGLEVKDQRSLNGVFVRITEEEALESGDSFRIGQELLRFDAINPPTPLEDGTEIIGTPNPGYWGRLSVVVGRDLDGPAFPLFDETAKLGRERGDILFPEDGYVSGSHCQLSVREGRVFLKDMGSSNGTFLRVREIRKIPTGSLMLMGQQLFRVAFK